MDAAVNLRVSTPAFNKGVQCRSVVDEPKDPPTRKMTLKERETASNSGSQRYHINGGRGAANLSEILDGCFFAVPGMECASNGKKVGIN